MKKQQVLRKSDVPDDKDQKIILQHCTYTAYVHKGDLRYGLRSYPPVWLREYEWSFTKCERDASEEGNTINYKLTDAVS